MQRLWLVRLVKNGEDESLAFEKSVVAINFNKTRDSAGFTGVARAPVT
jgi:predicted Mrr-cat superfamily restriction endonuclease